MSFTSISLVILENPLPAAASRSAPPRPAAPKNPRRGDQPAKAVNPGRNNSSLNLDSSSFQVTICSTSHARHSHYRQRILGGIRQHYHIDELPFARSPTHNERPFTFRREHSLHSPAWWPRSKRQSCRSPHASFSLLLVPRSACSFANSDFMGLDPRRNGIMLWQVHHVRCNGFRHGRTVRSLHGLCTFYFFLLVYSCPEPAPSPLVFSFFVCVSS